MTLYIDLEGPENRICSHFDLFSCFLMVLEFLGLVLDLWVVVDSTVIHYYCDIRKETPDLTPSERLLI